MIRMTWNGTDISKQVVITRCVHKDVSRGKCDLLDMELEHAATWYKWDPQKDDIVTVSWGGYSTGQLYLNAIYPEENHFRLLAASMPAAGRGRKYESWEKKKLSDVLGAAAGEGGMGTGYFGVSPSLDYTWLTRNNETGAEFAERIAQMEGAVLKIVDGAYKLIGIEYAQTLGTACTFDVDVTQPGAVYKKTEQERWQSITVKTPFASATCLDTKGKGGAVIRVDLPARTSGQARRWAKGLIMSHNRTAETLTITDAEFAPQLTAMAHVTVKGSTEASGEWLVDEAEHDLFHGRTTVRLIRFIDSIVG